MPPFLLGIATAIPGAAASTVGAVANIVGGVAATATSIVGNVAQTVGNLAINVVGMVVRTVAALPGLVINTVGGLLSAINNGGGVIVGALLKVGTVLGGLASGALAAFAKYLQISVRSMMDLARAAGQLRATTGLGYGTSAGVLQRFGAFGVGADSVQGMFGGQPAALFRLRASAFGLPGYDDPNFISAYAARRSLLMAGGLGGQMQAAAMDRLLGTDNPQFQALSNLSGAQIEGQQSYANRVFGGIGPEAIRKYATDVPLMIGRISTAFEALKQKAAVAALPILESIGNALGNIAAANLDTVVGGIQTAIQWLFVKAPLLAMRGAEWVINAAQAVVGKAVEITGYLAENLPQLLGGVTNTIADLMMRGAALVNQYMPMLTEGIANGLRGITGTIAGWMEGLGRALAGLGQEGNPLRGLIQGIADGLEVILNIGRHFSAMMAALGQIVENALYATPLGNAVALLLGHEPVYRNPVTVFNQTLNGSELPELSLATSEFLNSGRPEQYGAELMEAARRMREFGGNGADFITRAGSAAQTNLVNLLTGGANTIRPMGAQAGQFLQPYMAQLNGIARDSQEKIDVFKTYFQEYRQSLGTEEERTQRWQDEMLANTKEQTGLLRDYVRGGGSVEATDRTAAYMLLRWTQEQAGALRRAGGGAAG